MKRSNREVLSRQRHRLASRYGRKRIRICVVASRKGRTVIEGLRLYLSRLTDRYIKLGGWVFPAALLGAAIASYKMHFSTPSQGQVAMCLTRLFCFRVLLQSREAVQLQLQA